MLMLMSRTAIFSFAAFGLLVLLGALWRWGLGRRRPRPEGPTSIDLSGPPHRLDTTLGDLRDLREALRPSAEATFPCQARNSAGTRREA